MRRVLNELRIWLIRAVCLAIFSTGSESALGDYRAAQTYFNQRDFASAASAFFQAYGYPKSNEEKAKSEWGLAQSLQNLQLFYSASKFYSIIVRRGPKANNPFFRMALEELGKINATIPLGQSQIVELFKAKIDPAAVPGPARGFYFYYLGLEEFSKKRYEKADSYLRNVPAGSPYYIRAIFHLGVVSNLSGAHGRAISYFEKVKAAAPGTDEGEYLREVANLNIARVFYETKKFQEALRYYAQIPRDSDNWLEAHFEAAWTFFMLQEHNNALGNIHTIHSPFFENRFFPESYILQAVTFLRLCRYSQVKISLKEFKERYKPIFKELGDMLKRSRGDSREFFKNVYDYRAGTLSKYRDAWSILDALSRMDAYKEAGNTVRFVDQELAYLSRYQGRWNAAGLLDELHGFLSKKKSAAIADAGVRLYESGTGLYYYLKALSDQTHFINAEMLMGKVDALRAKLKVPTAEKRVQFIGGMKPLPKGEEIEFWPFEGEYWEDELGYYVFNIESKCGSVASGGSGGGKK